LAGIGRLEPQTLGSGRTIRCRESYRYLKHHGIKFKDDEFEPEDGRSRARAHYSIFDGLDLSDPEDFIRDIREKSIKDYLIKFFMKS
jgi:hypothetical protein